MVVLMIMLILTTLGISEITTTTTELKVAGNSRMQQSVFYGAEGGLHMYPSVLTETLRDRAVPARFTSPGGPVQDPAGLRDELFGFSGSAARLDKPEDRPDLETNLQALEVKVDLDRIQERLMGGSAAEFAGGYEGIGMSSAGGSIGIYYEVESLGQMGGSQGRVSEVYIHHVQ